MCNIKNDSSPTTTGHEILNLPGLSAGMFFLKEDYNATAGLIFLLLGFRWWIISNVYDVAVLRNYRIKMRSFIGRALHMVFFLSPLDNCDSVA